MCRKMSLLALAGAWLVAGAGAQEKADKADAQAKEAAVQFMKALKAEDVEAVMKVVEVPFFWDGVKNIKDRDELKKQFARVFADKDLTPIEYDIKEVHTFGKLPEKLLQKDRALLNEVLDKTDRIVIVTVKQGGIAVMVRFQEGKVKVAGFRD